MTWLYKNAYRFKITSTEAINPFLTTDVFNLGLTPAQFPLRHLTLTIKVGPEDLHIDYVDYTWAEPWRKVLFELLGLDQELPGVITDFINPDFAPLPSTKLSSSARLHIIFETGNVTEHLTYPAVIHLANLKPTIDAMQARGITVSATLRVPDVADFDVTPFAPILLTIVSEGDPLLDFYSGTEGAWKKALSEQLDDARFVSYVAMKEVYGIQTADFGLVNSSHESVTKATKRMRQMGILEGKEIFAAVERRTGKKLPCEWD